MKVPFSANSLRVNRPYYVLCSGVGCNGVYLGYGYGNHTNKMAAVTSANLYFNRHAYERVAVVDIRTGMVIWHKERG